MKYAHEVMGLMRPYEGRAWRMAEIVRGVEPRAVGRDRQRVRNGVLRVLEALVEAGSVECDPATTRGGFAVYRWAEAKKVPHALMQNCHANCHNTSGPLRA